MLFVYFYGHFDLVFITNGFKRIAEVTHVDRAGGFTLRFFMSSTRKEMDGCFRLVFSSC